MTPLLEVKFLEHSGPAVKKKQKKTNRKWGNEMKQGYKKDGKWAF